MSNTTYLTLRNYIKWDHRLMGKIFLRENRHCFTASVEYVVFQKSELTQEEGVNQEVIRHRGEKVVRETSVEELFSLTTGLPMNTFEIKMHAPGYGDVFNVTGCFDNLPAQFVMPRFKNFTGLNRTEWVIYDVSLHDLFEHEIQRYNGLNQKILGKLPLPSYLKLELTVQHGCPCQ